MKQINFIIVLGAFIGLSSCEKVSLQDTDSFYQNQIPPIEEQLDDFFTKLKQENPQIYSYYETKMNQPRTDIIGAGGEGDPGWRAASGQFDSELWHTSNPPQIKCLPAQIVCCTYAEINQGDDSIDDVIVINDVSNDPFLLLGELKAYYALIDSARSYSTYDQIFGREFKPAN